jgi:hypothetical protein
VQGGKKKRKDTHNLRKSQAQTGAGVNVPFGTFTPRLGSLSEPAAGGTFVKKSPMGNDFPFKQK